MIVYNAKDLSERILNNVKDEIQKNDYKIKLLIIQANNDNASNLYINNKIKQCTKVGIKCIHKVFYKSVSTEEIIETIKEANKEGLYTLVQLPLYNHLDKDKILNSIDPDLDIDSLTRINLGKMYEGDMSYLPLTPAGIITMFKDNEIDLKGKRAVVLGRSIISGKSMAMALLNEDCTVTICHSKTDNLKEECKQADILVCCMGKQLIDSSYIKDGAMVVNVGYDRVNNKTVGDIYFDDIVNNSKAGFVTEIFNCSGLLTTTMLVQRILDMFKRREE